MTYFLDCCWTSTNRIGFVEQFHNFHFDFFLCRLNQMWIVLNDWSERSPIGFGSVWYNIIDGHLFKCVYLVETNSMHVNINLGLNTRMCLCSKPVYSLLLIFLSSDDVFVISLFVSMSEKQQWFLFLFYVLFFVEIVIVPRFNFICCCCCDF